MIFTDNPRIPGYRSVVFDSVGILSKKTSQRRLKDLLRMKTPPIRRRWSILHFSSMNLKELSFHLELLADTALLVHSIVLAFVVDMSQTSWLQSMLHTTFTEDPMHTWIALQDIFPILITIVGCVTFTTKAMRLTIEPVISGEINCSDVIWPRSWIRLR